MPKSIEYSSNELVNMLCGTEVNRELALYFIYKKSGWVEEVRSIMLRYGHDDVSIKDAIHDSIIILDKNVRNGQFKHEYTLKNYFFGICLGRVKSNKRTTRRIEDDVDVNQMNIEIIDTPESTFLQEELKNTIQKLLNLMDKTCQELLKKYMLSFSMKEIREILNIKSDVMTRKKAHECRSKLAQLIDSNPTIKRFLKEHINR